jgi:hypothetical protein
MATRTGKPSARKKIQSTATLSTVTPAYNNVDIKPKQTTNHNLAYYLPHFVKLDTNSGARIVRVKVEMSLRVVMRQAMKTYGRAKT